MSIIKSFSVGVGDMFYIKHGSDNFTIIDCSLSDDNKQRIVEELEDESKNKGIKRFISTHPDEDHVQQLDYLDDNIPISNFYCVKNEATKAEETDGFKRYCKLRDSDKVFNIFAGCSRKWMNITDKIRGSAGISIKWPKTENSDYNDALTQAKNGESPNNISPIIRYNLNDGAKVVWMGDLENAFMEKIKDEVDLEKANVLFAPHHGRESGKVPKEWMENLDPDIVVMGEAPSENLDYAAYNNYNKITQNSAGDIVFDCIAKKVHVYVSKEGYSVDFLKDENMSNNFGCYYLGTLLL